MRRLKRHELEFDLTFDFAKNLLESGNTLSTEMLKSVNFEEGQFFVLLPEGADVNRINNFSTGGLLPRGPLKEIKILNKIYQGEMINSLSVELANFIINHLKANDHRVCVFENVQSHPNDPHNQLEDKELLRYYNNEVYYFVDKKNLIFDKILSCIKNSNVFWHFLCVISQIDLKDTLLTTTESFSSISKHAIYIIFGAYDGEGYIFWKKNEIIR